MMTENWVFDAAFLDGVFVFGLLTVETAGTGELLIEGTAGPSGTDMTRSGGAPEDSAEGKVVDAAKDAAKLCADGLMMVPPINPEA